MLEYWFSNENGPRPLLISNTPLLQHSNIRCKVNNPGPKGPGFDQTLLGYEVRVRPFSRGHISKRIPPVIAVTQYLGFAPLSFWESATHSLNLKYWVTSPSQYRYGLEKWGVASHRHDPVPLTNRILNNHFTSKP